MPISVRRAGPAEAACITEFNRLLACETEHRELDPATVSAGVTAALADPARGFYLVAELNDEAVGQLLVTPEWSDWRNGWFWWIQSVYVRADARGRGVFAALYGEAARQAREAGDVVGLRLYVERDNERARGVYERLGMAETPYRLYEQGLA